MRGTKQGKIGDKKIHKQLKSIIFKTSFMPEVNVRVRSGLGIVSGIFAAPII